MEIESVVSPKRPNPHTGWVHVKEWRAPEMLKEFGYPSLAWVHHESGLYVLSAVEVVNEPGNPEIGPEYHLSVSMRGERCTTADAVWVLAQFGLWDAKEDNHVPSGKCRNFWRPVADKMSGYECPCVAQESAIAEDKGDFVWRA